jgi:hypothetical protein
MLFCFSFCGEEIRGGVPFFFVQFLNFANYASSNKILPPLLTLKVNAEIIKMVVPVVLFCV